MAPPLDSAPGASEGAPSPGGAVKVRASGAATRRRRPWFRLLFIVALLAALAVHIVHHYVPRERAAIPAAGDLPARLLAEGQFDAVVWLPYPHQNLEAALGDSRVALQEAARAAGRPAPRVPSFGPFPLPPSEELTLALDDDGRRFQLVARIYPGLALVARLAGRLASNPWLEGGPVVLDGQPAQVRWQDGLWIVASDAQPGPEDAAPLTAEEAGPLRRPLLAALRLRQATGPLPAGLYPLERRPELGRAEKGKEAGPLVLRRAGVGAVELPPESRPETLWQPYQALLVLQSETGSTDVAAFLLFRDTVPSGLVTGATDPASAVGGDKRGFALLQARTGRDLTLGAVGVSALLGKAGYSGQASGWRVQANNEANFLRGTLLVPRLQQLVNSTDGPRVRFAFLLDPAAADPVLADLEAGTERLLISDLSEAAQLRALRRLLQQLDHAGRIRVTVTEPAGFELVVE